jgi:hypothetical protein
VAYSAHRYPVAVDAGVDLIIHLPGYSFAVDADGRAEAGASPAEYEISDRVARRAGRR